MAIYTKTGDKGQTAIFGGARVSKADPRVHAYGTIDELTSVIGLVAALINDDEERRFLISVQKSLYKMMALVAGAPTSAADVEPDIDDFEKRIDSLEKQLPKLTRFILPGGSVLSGWYHILRTTCRRSEREVVAFLAGSTPHTIPQKTQRIMLKYLNRLSDLFFMMARKNSQGSEVVT